MDSFEQELKSGFLDEADQLLSDAERCFLSLEASPGDSSLLDKIFRLAHNLKGSAKAVGFDGLGAFTHEFESFLLKMKRGEIAVDPPAISLLLKCNDHIRATLIALRADFSAKIDSSALVDEINRHALAGGAPEGGGEAHPLVDADPPPADSFTEEGNSASNLETPEEPPQTQAQNLSAGEVSSKLQVLAERSSSKPSAPPPPAVNAGAQTEESIRVSLGRVEKLINFVGELVILQAVLREQSLSDNQLLLRKTIQQIGKVTKEVQDLSMSLRMVPLKQTFQKMQRIVRDTCSALGKRVNLVMKGEDTELDKTVLESLSDPLVHLIRNAVDHGIESAADRLKAAKPEQGNILLQSYHQSGKLVIEITDDGAGIDPERLTLKAIEKGILRPGTKLERNEAINLIFHPGFSTKAEVSEVSGRGVGMDVVRTNIEGLQGNVQVITELGKGTTFRVVLPLTLAIIDGMVIQAGDNRFVVPLSHVHESIRPAREDVKTMSAMGEMVLLRGESIPLYRLGALLGRRDAAAQKNAWDSIALVVRTMNQPFCVLVDDILGQYQVVIKRLGSEIRHLKGITGSAILGDGKPALILELSELVSSPKQGRAGSGIGTQTRETPRGMAA